MREVADLNELSAKQKRVAELLAAGFTRAEAAKRQVTEVNCGCQDLSQYRA
jgi:hypothetical protein